MSSRVLERNHAIAAVVLPVRSLGHADGHHQQRNLALVPRRDRSLDLVRLERTHERRAETERGGLQSEVLRDATGFKLFW